MSVSQFPVEVEGAGTVEFASGIAIDADATDVVVVVAADLDGDGDQDLLAGSYFEDWVRVYQNNAGTGTFLDPIDIVSASGYGGVT